VREGPAPTTSLPLTLLSRYSLSTRIKNGFIVQLSERLPALLYTPNKEGSEKEKERRTAGEQGGREGRKRRERQLLVPLVLRRCTSHMDCFFLQLLLSLPLHSHLVGNPYSHAEL
jgi:hypothetical protein